MTIGSLGLGAWGILTSAGPDVLPESSLDILLMGVTIALFAPLLFRNGGTEGTRLGMDTFVNIGYVSIGIALVSFLPAVLPSWTVGVALAAIVVLIAREAFMAAEEIARMGRLMS